MGSTTGDGSIVAPDVALPTNAIIRFFRSHPIGFWFIFWGEFAERCSFYGMRAILARYMAEQLHLGQANATTYSSFFLAASYFLPMLGGYLADNFFGKYRIIVWFSVPYILGHVILSVENEWFMAFALVLLAMGSGVIKPNISTLMGMTYDQQRPGQERLRSDAFAIFYMAINIGAAVSIYTVPWIRTNFSYSLAFMFPAALMVLAFILFAAGKPFYATEVIVRKKKTPEERRQQWQVVGQIAGLFILVAFFWAIFDQSTTTWVFFANTYMDRTFFGHEFDPEQFGTLNPLLIVLLVPVVTLFVNFLIRRGVRIRPTDKMVVGFLLTAMTMGAMAVAGYRAGSVEGERPVMKDGNVVMREGQPEMEAYVPPEKKVTIWWQVLAFFLITVAEILISVTGLELAFTAAPKSMKSFVTGLWLAAVGLGNLFFNAPVGRLYPLMHPGNYFAMLTAMLLVVTVAFVFVARRFNRQSTQAAAEVV
jgi:POT family proton-dependent oligopeptide transporter